jgi:hypothetical protein
VPQPTTLPRSPRQAEEFPVFLFLDLLVYVNQKVNMNWMYNLSTGAKETDKPTELLTKYWFYWTTSVV